VKVADRQGGGKKELEGEKRGWWDIYRKQRSKAKRKRSCPLVFTQA